MYTPRCLIVIFRLTIRINLALQHEYVYLEIDFQYRTSASNRNEYQESLKIKTLGGKVRLARRADNLAAIY
jgi:hypothetical protein